MIATGTDILRFIPQRAPMVMIDTLIASGEHETLSGFTIDAGNIFADSGLFSESGMVENIAQTAAAGVGYRCREAGQPVPLGFIAVVKNLNVEALPPVGATIETSVIAVNQVLDVSIVEGTVRCNGKVMASCELRIFVKSENHEANP